MTEDGHLGSQSARHVLARIFGGTHIMSLSKGEGGHGKNDEFYSMNKFGMM